MICFSCYFDKEALLVIRFFVAIPADFSTPPVGSARNDSNGKFTAAFVKIDNREHLSPD